MTQIKIVEVGSEVDHAEDHINTALKKLQDKGYFIQDIKYHETKFSQYCTIMYDDNLLGDEENKLFKSAEVESPVPIDDHFPKFEELPEQLFIMRYYSGIVIDGENHKFPKIFKDDNMVRVTLSNDVFDKVSLIETLRSTFTKIDRGGTTNYTYTINKILTRGKDEIPGIPVTSFCVNEFNVDSVFEDIATVVALMHQNYHYSKEFREE